MHEVRQDPNWPGYPPGANGAAIQEEPSAMNSANEGPATSNPASERTSLNDPSAENPLAESASAENPLAERTSMPMLTDTAPGTARDALAAFREMQRRALPMWRALGAPELQVRPVSRFMAAVMCPHCETLHYHGFTELPSHRLAHCYDPSSPYRATGYILVPGRAA